MIKPMEWREALELICQFTGTHVTTDYQGRLLLKNGYGGTLTDDDALVEEERRRQGRRSRTTSGAPAGSGPGASRPSSASSSSGGGYRETVENSRAKGDGTHKGVKYNKGRKPNTIFDTLR